MSITFAVDDVQPAVARLPERDVPIASLATHRVLGASPATLRLVDPTGLAAAAVLRGAMLAFYKRYERGTLYDGEIEILPRAHDLETTDPGEITLRDGGPCYRRCPRWPTRRVRASARSPFAHAHRGLVEDDVDRRAGRAVVIWLRESSAKKPA